MKKLILIPLLLCVFAGSALILVFSGCEESSKGTVALTVTPSYVDLSAASSNETQTFTVTHGLRDLSLPLAWHVSNPGLGTIGGSGGDSASYVSTGASGDNSVIVEDQYGAEGVATVRQ